MILKTTLMAAVATFTMASAGTAMAAQMQLAQNVQISHLNDAANGMASAASPRVSFGSSANAGAPAGIATDHAPYPTFTPFAGD